MEYFVTRDGRQEGPLSLDEINQRLSEGTLSPSDLAWTESMGDWKPLQDIPDVVVSIPGAPWGAEPAKPKGKARGRGRGASAGSACRDAPGTPRATDQRSQGRNLRTVVLRLDGLSRLDARENNLIPEFLPECPYRVCLAEARTRWPLA